MTTILLTLVVVGVAVLLLSIGTIISNKQLNTSCSGTGEECSCKSDEAKECENKNITQSR